MSDEDQWPERQDATFRGVPFHFVSSKGKTGRRTQAHEYPKRDGGFPEDNGGVLQNETIQALLVGETAEAEFQALLNALNIAGPGELVHPYWGIQQVQVGNVDYDLDNNERHKATLSFTVYAAADSLSPNQQADTQQQASTAANEAEVANEEQLTGEMNTLLPEQATTFADTVDKVLSDLDNFTTSLPCLPDSLGEWVDRLDKLKGSVGRLVAYPGEIARDITTLITDVKDLVTEMPQALDVYEQLVQTWDGLLTEIELAPIELADIKGELEKQTEKATYLFTRNAAVIAKTQAITAIDSEQTGFQHSQQAQQVALQISTQLQQLAAQAIESNNRDGWRAFRSLRYAIADDLTFRVQKLPLLNVVSPQQTMPIALLAYQLTGDTENRTLMVKRNQLSRPSFITPHQRIEFVVDVNNG